MKSFSISILLSVLLLFAVVPSCLSDTTKDPRLAALGASSLSLGEHYFSDRSVLSLFLYPYDTVTADAAYVVRYVLLQVVSGYDVVAACSPRALSFLGTRDRVPSSVCSSPDAMAETALLLTLKLLSDEMPEEAVSLRLFVNGVGILNKKSERTDWAYKQAERLSKYFRQDGWNSRGNPPFSDTSGYVPSNAPAFSPGDRVRPLRWTPAIRYASRGRFEAQVAVFAHLGRAKPLILTRAQFQSRRARSPFKKAWSWGEIDDDDEATVWRLANETMKESDLSKKVSERRALAVWWESKLASAGMMTQFYAQSLEIGKNLLKLFGMLLGDMAAQHDAMLLAFKEKRRHDLARPQAVIRRVMEGQKQWTSLLAAQPHSEFPSASTALCTASMEFLGVFGRGVAKEKGMKGLGAFETVVKKSIFNPKGMERGVRVKFETPEAAAKQCGESRVWAGVHFRSAVTEGERLVGGLGKAAAEHVRDLMEGRRPRQCWRCGKL